MKTKLNALLVAGLLWAGLQLNLHAQLVPDGGYKLLTAQQSFNGDVIVGTLSTTNNAKLYRLKNH